MIPAHQRLGSSDRASPKIPFWLVVHFQLLPFDGMAQAGFQIEPLAGQHGRPGQVELVVITPHILSPVQGDVGIFQQQIPGAAITGIQADPNATGDTQLLIVQPDRLRHQLQHSLGNTGRLITAVQIGEQHRKLIATLARNSIALASTSAQARCNLLKQAVTDRVT